MATSSRPLSIGRAIGLLTRAQLSYRLSTIVFVLLLEFGLLSALLVFARPDLDEVTKIAAGLTLMFGCLLGVFGWGVDTFERRVRMLITLPVPRTAVAVSRLLGVFVMQAVVSGLAWFLTQLSALWRGEVAGDAYLFVLVAAWTLSFVYATLVFEEINVAANFSRTLVYGINVLFLALVFFAALHFEGFLTPTGLLIAVPLALGLAVAEVALFRARATFDVGVSPWHGLPTDWSGE